MTTPTTSRLTYWDLLRMPEDGRQYQLIDGEAFMTPSPNEKHQRAVFNLTRLLGNLVEEANLGRVYSAPFDVVLDEMNVLQPDVLFVSRDRLSVITSANVWGAPDLAIEVLSSSTAGLDRKRKQQIYARSGVAELWYVDPETHEVEVLVLGPTGSYELRQTASGNDRIESRVLPGLELAAASVFS